VLVDPNASGIERIELPMRWREGARQFQLTFNQVETPAEELVGAEGQGLLALVAVHPHRAAADLRARARQRQVLSLARAGAGGRADDLRQAADGAEQAIQHRSHRCTRASRRPGYWSTALLTVSTRVRTRCGWRVKPTMAKVLTADLLFDAADHAMQTLGAQAWDEREGMIDLFLLTENKRLQKIWTDCYFWSLPYYLAGGALAAMLDGSRKGWAGSRRC